MLCSGRSKRSLRSNRAANGKVEMTDEDKAKFEKEARADRAARRAALKTSVIPSSEDEDMEEERDEPYEKIPRRRNSSASSASSMASYLADHSYPTGSKNRNSSRKPYVCSYESSDSGNYDYSKDQLKAKMSLRQKQRPAYMEVDYSYDTEEDSIPKEIEDRKNQYSTDIIVEETVLSNSEETTPTDRPTVILGEKPQVTVISPKKERAKPKPRVPDEQSKLKVFILVKKLEMQLLIDHLNLIL